MSVITKNLNKNHLSVVKDVFQYCLCIISHLIERENSRMFFVEAGELVQAWISHHNVIGGSSVGGDRGTKLPEEIRVKSIFCLKY